MPRADTHKKRATLLRIIAEVRKLKEIQTDDVMELCDCSDSGARKYLMSLFDAGILVKLRCAWVRGGSFGPRIYGLTDDELLIGQFIADHSPKAELTPSVAARRTRLGYLADQAARGRFVHMDHYAESVKVRRDDLVAALFGAAGAAGGGCE